MALTIPHPRRTNSTPTTLIASAVVVMSSLAFGGYQLATHGGSTAGTTGSVVQTVDPVDTSAVADAFVDAGLRGLSPASVGPVEPITIVSELTGGVLNPGGQAAVGSTVTGEGFASFPSQETIEEIVARQELIASIEARYPYGGEAPDVGQFAPTTETHPLAVWNVQWPTGPEPVGQFAPATEAHPLTARNAQWPTGPEPAPPERVGPGGQFR